MREGESCKGTPGNYICQIPVWKSLLESAVEYCAWAEGRKKMKALKSFFDNTNKIITGLGEGSARCCRANVKEHAHILRPHA